MGKHLFSKVINGQRVLFAGHANDAEFEAILSANGRQLPAGVIVTHLDDDETVDNSARARALAKLPTAKRDSFLMGQAILADVPYTELF